MAFIGQILENIGPAARAIQKINFSNIAQPGMIILDVSLLEIDSICIMTEVGIYGEIKPGPSENPLGSAYIPPLTILQVHKYIK